MHVAILALVYTDVVGNVIPRTSSIGKVIETFSVFRVLPDKNIASSLGYPTLEEYLADEAASGYKLVKLCNGLVITEGGGGGTGSNINLNLDTLSIEELDELIVEDLELLPI